MNGIVLLILDLITAVMFTIAAVYLYLNSKPKTKHKAGKISNSNMYNSSCVLNDILFMLIYHMSGQLDEKVVVNYLTNAIKLGANRGWLETKTGEEINAELMARSLYQAIIQDVEESE